ncbi:MAG: phosphonate C-P lyase system protein PhnL [Acidimicrobiales bacterium]
MTDQSDPTESPILRVVDLHKSFTLHAIDGRDVVALDGVSIDVSPGEHVALAGTSGAGKSSLLKCVFRTYLPSAGRVWFQPDNGGPVDLVQLPDAELASLREHQIGYVSQFLRAEPRRGVLDVVARAGLRRGMGLDAARDAAADALRRVNIAESLWQTYPTLLSGGEKQRVNLAAGTIQPPRLLLLDEPVSALDPENRESVLDLIADLTTKGVAVLAVFHDLDAMLRLASRVVLMRQGRVADMGDPAAVLGAAPAVAS